VRIIYRFKKNFNFNFAKEVRSCLLVAHLGGSDGPLLNFSDIDQNITNMSSSSTHDKAEGNLKQAGGKVTNFFLLVLYLN
jgi:hypothetical protein